MTPGVATGWRANRLFVVVPIVLGLALASRTTGRDSCTVDEFGNLPLAVAYWTHGALHIDRGNPPLTRWIQGIPLLGERPDPGGSRVELSTIETSWDLGYRFEAVHQDDYHELLVRARWMSVVLYLATVVGVFVWASSLGGATGGLLAALLAAASPNLLAHGRLVTPDVGVTCFVVWAGWAASRALASGSLAFVTLAGALSGAACLSKFSALLLPPTLGAVFLFARGSRTARAIRTGTFLAATLLVAYAGYGFPPPGSLAGWPTPLPAPLALGIETQLTEPAYPAYLLGDVRDGGWRAYYFVAVLVKTPLPTLALLAVASVLCLRERRTGFAFPMTLAALFFLALSFATNKNVGVRYLLPALPLALVAASFLFSHASPRLRRGSIVAAVLSIASGVLASEAPLAYFNGVERFWGGKRQVLVDSNLDWGQALPDLKEWMEREGVKTIRLAYFGRVNPDLYGIQWRSPPAEPMPDPVAISATLAVGRPYVVLYKPRPFLEPTLAWSQEDSWEWIQRLEPDEELGGGAILVWRDAAGALGGARE